MEIKPGEFFLFHERTPHHWEQNRSNQRRIGLAIRVIVPIVRILVLDIPRHRVVVIRGEARRGFNLL